MYCPPDPGGIVIGWAKPGMPRKMVKSTIDLPEDVARYIRWFIGRDKLSLEDCLALVVKEMVTQSLESIRIKSDKDAFDLTVEVIPGSNAPTVHPP